MTVGGETKETWIRLPGDLKPAFETVSFPRGDYEVGYDLDRKDLGFSFQLKTSRSSSTPALSSPRASRARSC
jgi:hypothetical protein